MKIFIFIAFSALIAVTYGVFVPPRHPKQHKHVIKECANGPSYWCKNLTAAADCHATKHCIDTVWVHMEVPPDHNSVCDICLDMVKQARDQLMSNETQDLIKQVFETECSYLRIKPIVKECDKIADNYIPDLIDTLASEMNPQVVCSVAGLCNSEWVHKLLAEAGESTGVAAPKVNVDTCTGCHTVMNLVETKFKQLTKDQVLMGFLEVCGKMSSLSDSCSNIILTYFTDIYNHLQDNLNSNDVCLMAGECSAQFHQHANVEVIPQSHIGYVDVNEKDELPCDLCKQLVQHLRDLLIAKTTENEFKLVLQGLCKQTKSFAQECLSIVDEYYGEIYNFLVSELNTTAACEMIGICPNNKFTLAPIAPLLPVETVQKTLDITPSSVKIISSPEKAQLPIDLLMPPHTQIMYNSEACIFCQYFLHYVQQAITNPATEEEIKEVIEKGCAKLPNSVNTTCIEFVNTYEPAMVAILAQEIDPSQVCPLLKICPASSRGKDVEIFMHPKPKVSNKCPLCLFAVTQLEEMVKNKNTEANIRGALTKLCSHFSDELAKECNDFVNTYTDELVEMLVADLNPQEVCVYLRLCSDETKVSTTAVPQLPDHSDSFFQGGDIETNAIPDNTINGVPVKQIEKDPQCVLCEFVMQKIEEQLKDKSTDDEIKNVVHNICHVLPKSISDQCNSFVDQYADTIIQLLIASLQPNEICAMMKLCEKPSSTPDLHGEIVNCAVCEVLIKAVEKILDNPKADHEIEHVLEKACRALPSKYMSKCQDIIEKYGKTIIDLIGTKSARVICHDIGQCVTSKAIPSERIVGLNQCTWGPSYWCASQQNADDCGARKHCVEKVWLGEKPNQDHLLGTKECTWGPSYWCETEENANKCGNGARKHCVEKVWLGEKPNHDHLLGAKECTWGPSYWCETEENANKCGNGARKHCETKVWLGSKPQTQTEQAVGTNPCTFGPGFWCASEENADKCPGARTHCETKVWLGKRPKRQVAVGTNPCTYGPGYWCASEENADRCPGARNHCETKVWLGKKPKV